MLEKSRRMPQVGETLKGIYMLQAELGEGGFAKAFSGEDMQQKLPVAVKALKIDSQNEIINFSLEAFRMTRLNHPHIVKVIDYDAEEHTLPYIVMPLAKNGSLKKEIREYGKKGGQVPLERSIAVLEQIGSALGYLHNKRIVHQDVKPDNILEPNEVTVWVSDLGIARILKPDESFSPRLMGFSPHYVSPEQLRGQAEPASDQYSLGITAFYLFTGRLPFIDGDITLKQLLEKPISLAEAIDQLQKGERIINILRALDPIVQKSLAKQPDQRYPAVEEFTGALTTVYKNAATEKVVKVFKAAKPGKQHPTPMAQTGGDGEPISPIKIPTLSARETLRIPDIDEQEKANRRKTIAQLFPIAEGFLKAGEKEKALEVFNEVLDLDPTSYNGLLEKGRLLGELGRYQEAINTLDIIPTLEVPVYLDPVYSNQVYYEEIIRICKLCGDNLIKQGNFVDALQVFDYVFALYNQPWLNVQEKIKDPEYEKLYYRRNGRQLKSIPKNFLDYLKSSSERYRKAYGEVYQRKVTVLFKMGRYEETLTIVEQLLHFIVDTHPVYPKNRAHKLGDEMDEMYGQMLVLQGDLYTHAGRYQKALEALQAAEFYIDISDEIPEYFLLPLKKGYVFEKLGKCNEAVAEYEEALHNNPNGLNVYALTRKGNCFLVLHNYQEAEQTFETLTKLAPADGNAWRCKGLAYENQKKYEEALTAYENALSLTPVSKGLLTRKMAVLTQLSQPTKALEVYKQIQNLPKTNNVFDYRCEQATGNVAKKSEQVWGYPFSTDEIPTLIRLLPEKDWKI